MVATRRARAARSLLRAACTILLAAVPAAAGDLANVLQPGSRASLALGGDPFLSPLADETGWWASFPWSSQPAARVDMVSGQTLTEAGSGDRGRLHDTRLAWTLAGGKSAGPVRLLAGLREEGRSSEDRWRATGGDVRLDHDAHALAAAMRIEAPAQGLVLQGVLPARNGRGSDEAGIGARWARGSVASAQGSFTRTDAPDVLFAEFRGERVDGSLNLRADTYRADARLRPWRLLEVEASGSSVFLGPISPRDDAYVYEYLPHGHLFTQQAALALGRPGARALARWTRADLDADALGVWGGQSFGGITVLHGGVTSWLGGGEYRDRRRRRWLADAERVNLQGRVHGYAESWPFTSILVDLLGVQGVADAVASVSWWRVHSGVELPMRGGMTGLLSVTGYDARPDARLLTYQTGFAGIGAQNVSLTRLSVTRVRLAGASLGGRGKVRAVEWSLRLRQFFFARSERAGVTGAGPGVVATPAGATPGARRGWPGGTQVEASLRYAW